MKCEIERMEINYTFYFFAFLRKMIKKLLTFCYWTDELIFVGAGNERAVNDGYNDYYCIFIMQYLYHIF